MDLRAGDIGSIRLTAGLARSLRFEAITTEIDTGDWAATVGEDELVTSIDGSDVLVAFPEDASGGVLTLSSAGSPVIKGRVVISTRGTPSPDETVLVRLDEQTVTVVVMSGPAGPQGEPGDTGEQGIQGEQGETGPAGTTDYNALSNKPTLGTAAATDSTAYATAAQGATADAAAPAEATTAALALKAPLASPTGTGTATWPVLTASGLTGATAASRWAGATTSGPPTTGTFAIGDFVIDRTGVIWICSAAGTPGTWVDGSSSGRRLAYASSTTVQTGISTVTDLAGLTIPDFTIGSRPGWVEAVTGFTFPVTSTAVALLTVTNSANVVQGSGYAALASTSVTGTRVRCAFPVDTPGTYSGWKVRLARASGTGTITNGIDATTPSFVKVITE